MNEDEREDNLSICLVQVDPSKSNPDITPDWQPNPATPYKSSHRGKEFLFTTCGSRHPLETYASFSWEQEIRDEWWTVEPEHVVIDVGAGVGSYTLPALACGASVVAVDPCKESQYVLGINLLLNGWITCCRSMGILLGEKIGIHDYYPYSHSNRPEGRREDRPVLTLDWLVSIMAGDRLDWIKIDVEGSEVEVVKGGLQTIAERKPKLLIENHEGYRSGVCREIRELLLPLGYAEQTRHGEGINDCWSLWEHKG